MKLEGRQIGKRIALRGYRKTDLEFVSGMWFDKENGKYLSDPEKGYIDEKFQKAVDEMADSPLGYYFVAEMLETGELIGSCCAFPDYDSEDRLIFDIGYCVHKSYWRQGYGRDILFTLLNWIKAQGGVSVTAEAAKENTASVELLKKSGFEVIKESSFKKYNMNISFDSYIFWRVLKNV